MYTAVSARLYERAEAIAGDPGTHHLIVGTINEVDKDLWMIRAHLTGSSRQQKGPAPFGAGSDHRGFHPAVLPQRTVSAAPSERRTRYAFALSQICELFSSLAWAGSTSSIRRTTAFRRPSYQSSVAS